MAVGIAPIMGSRADKAFSFDFKSEQRGRIGTVMQTYTLAIPLGWKSFAPLPSWFQAAADIALLEAKILALQAAGYLAIDPIMAIGTAQTTADTGLWAVAVFEHSSLAFVSGSSIVVAPR